MIVADGHRWLEVADGTVTAAGSGRPPRPADEQLAGRLSPGLVDLQVNGAGGFEVTGDDAALDAIEALLLAHGVTAWLPTIVTTDDGTAEAAVARLAARAADPASTVAGIHAEGPFLSPDYRGMHRAALLRTPAGGVPAWLRDPAVRLVTLAPELPGALALVEELADAGVVVSLGHTAASAEAARAAADAGARMVTHLFNATRPLTHRAPGIAAVALTDERLALGLIADGEHVDPLVLDVVRAAAGDRVVLVSDASPAAFAPEPVASFAGVSLDPDGRVAGRPAGGLRLLDDGTRLWGDVAAATTRPAALLGLAEPLSPGTSADLVEWAPDGGVRRVMRRGRWIDRRGT